MSRRDRSIAVTLSAALVTVTTLLLTGAGVEAYLSRRARVWAELRASVAANADRAAIALALPIWSFDRAQIDRVVESTMRDPDIHAVVVEAPGRTHAVLRDAGGTPVPFDGVVTPAMVSADDLLREERPVLFGTERIGSVAVYMTPRLELQLLRRSFVSVVVLIAAVEASLVAILSLVLWRIVLKPLRSVERYAEAVSSGKRPDATLPAATFRGEMESVRASICRMVSLLDARYAELTRSEERFRTLFNASDDAIFVNSIREDGSSGTLTDVNDVACQRLGWSRQELLALPVEAFDPHFHEPAIQEAIATLLRGDRATVVFESEHRARGGRVFPVEISAHRFDIAGEPLVISVVRDVTHRKAAEEAIHALATRLQAAREEEKARIARDLHDDLGQLLTGIKMDLRAIEQKVVDLPDAARSGAVVDDVVALSTLVEQTVTTVQRIAADLRPSVLDRLGLGAALRHEARRFAERTGIRCDVDVDDALPRLDDDAATALYRVAQEALTNVARHAAASRATITLRAERGAVSLRVEDDGRGMAPIAPGPSALGLLGMRERAATFGGDVTFARTPSGGTMVDLKVPLARVSTPRPVEAT